MFDPEVPLDLLDLQKWFGKVIARPLPSAMPPETITYIKPSPSLTAKKRLEIYHQQYWWRLLEILQGHFPTVLRLFGTHGFNQTFAIPFLLHSPPCHFSLTKLGDTLPFWIKENYEASDSDLIVPVAEMDWAYTEAFTAAPGYVRDFSLSYDLFAFRAALLEKDVLHWATHPFPSLGKEGSYHFTLFRNAAHEILYKSNMSFQA